MIDRNLALRRSLYIAGPMSGKPNLNYPAFLEAEERLHAAGFKCLNPVDAEKKNPMYPDPARWDWYMREAIIMLLSADGVAVLPGWEMSKGASLEVQIAQALGLRVLTVEQWLDDARNHPTGETDGR